MTQNRWTSKVLWISIIAQTVSILIMTNVIDLALGDQINNVAMAVLELFVLFGIVNNPTNSEKL